MSKTDSVAVYEKESTTLAEQAEVLMIVDADSMKSAVSMLSLLNTKNDAIEEEEDKVVAPLKQALKAEQARWKPIKTALGDAIAVIRSKMTVFQTAEIRRAKEEEAVIAARVGAGKGKLKVETAVKKFGEIARADKSVISDAGMVKFRTDKKLKIWDETLIPREYLLVNETKILATLKAGTPVEGCAIEEVQTPINIR